MKINLPAHTAVETDNLKIKDIPLGYLNAEFNDYHLNTVIEKDFLSTKNYKLQPYDEFDESEICVFDENGNSAAINLKRNGNVYNFLPDDFEEFTPQRFYCALNVKHDITFTNDRTFDLSVRVDSYGIYENLSTRLLSIFGDAYKRGTCPANIMINGGSMTTDSMFYDIYEGDNVDFVFIESDDGTMYLDHSKPEGDFEGTVEIEVNNESERIIDLTQLTAVENKNVWLIVNSFEDLLYASTNYSDQIVVDNPVTVNKIDFETPGMVPRFFTDKTLSDTFFDYTQHYISDAILVLSYPNRGSVIVSHADLFSSANIQAASSLIYETLIYVYTHSYKNVESGITWITDEPVDYSAFQQKRLNRSHGKLNLNQMLEQAGVKANDAYNILSVTTSNGNVIFSGMSDNGDMKFTKISGRNEPTKTAEQISYFTTKGTVVLFKQESNVEWIEEKILITEKISGSDVYVQIQPYKNSKYKIFTTQMQELKIPDNRFKYFLVTKPVLPPMTNTFELILESDYDEETHGIKIAEVSVKSNFVTQLNDMRILGGGLPEIFDDDYNLIDIGNALGRPYCKSFTLIIRLPKKFEVYKDRIQTEIDKHISTGDYPILIFEDRNNF